MALDPGTRLGPFEIAGSLGAGGMGEVYRARDTKLGRDVALKILPSVFAADPDRLARFQREAQLLASLNHPHIAAIYGVEESDGIRALVLELVAGATLADRIAEGPMPLDEALPIARQICDALEAAHDCGIIHRDLKPANIKLRPDGTVKVLDFGLAKALEPAAINGDAMHSPTVTSPAMTALGMILGTAAYMSPEQAKGRPADMRSDVWAFGCVLFEMLTGTRAFDGEDISETVAFILTRTPDWTRLPPATPPSIRRLLVRCLHKDRRTRLAHIADGRLELLDVGDLDTALIPGQPPAAWGHWLPWAIAGALLLAMLAVAANPRDLTDTHVYRTSILLAVGPDAPTRLGGLTGNRGPALALSPDGRTLVFLASDVAGHTVLWLRALDSQTPRRLTGTEDSRSPFWSPDSRWLAFVAADNTLRKIEPSSGRIVTLCGNAFLGGAWSNSGVILFTQNDNVLAQVLDVGGSPSVVTKLDPIRPEYIHYASFFLPDGRRFVYTATASSGEPIGTYVASLDGPGRTELAIGASFLQYTAGSLLFLSNNTLEAQRFDASRATVEGRAVPIAEDLRTSSSGTFFSASAAGALVFATEAAPAYELTWFNRAGQVIGKLGTPDDYADLSLSPDGRRAVVSIGERGTTNRDLWMFDVARGIKTRFTSDGAAETHNAWSPDGSRVVFDSNRGGHRDLFQKPSTGATEESLLFTDEFDKNPIGWSPDGRFITYVRRSGGTSNIWVLPLFGERKSFSFTNSQFNVGGNFSPDGRWVAYFSRDTGRFEVYVAPFPGPGPKTLISTNGGQDAWWSRGGKEIVYLDMGSGKVMSAAIELHKDTVEVGEVKPLFDLQKVGQRRSYDITDDGERILAITRTRDETSGPLTLLLNWPALLGPR